MAKFLINRVDFGKRIGGYKLFDSESKEIIGLTEKRVKYLLKAGIRVYGFIQDPEENLQLDKEKFHTNNIMIETGIGSLKPLKPSGVAVNVFFVLVSVNKGKEGTTYEVVNSRYGRTYINENHLKSLLKIGCVSGGVFLDSEEKLVLCEGVEVITEYA
jgi:hypothetical protein